MLIFGSLIDGYYTSRTFNRIASSVAIITVVAVGQTLVVLTRNIDLSVGSIVGFTAYFVGTLIADHNGIVAAAGGADRGRARRGDRASSTACWWPGAACRRSSSRSGRSRSIAACWSTIRAPRPSPPTACRNGWSTCRA